MVSTNRDTSPGEWIQSILQRGRDGDVCLHFQRQVTYRELREQVSTWVERLAAQGIGAGSTVALQVPPSFTYIHLLLALWRNGAQVVLLDHRLKPAEVSQYMGLCAPEFLVRARELGGILTPFKEDREVVVEATGTGSPSRTDHCLLQFTSGSSGLPKVIGRTSASLVEEVERWNALEGGMTGSDRILLLSSPTHSLGLAAGILHSFYVGAAIVFSPTNQGSDITATLAAAEPSVIVGAPFHYELLASSRADKPSRQLRIAISGGERLRPEVHQQFEGKYGVRIGDAYGMTEVGIIAVDPTGKLFPRTRIAPGIRLELREGEIFVALERTPYVYTDDAERFGDGWLRTYDRGELDAERQSLLVLGRSDSLVIIGGLKVNLIEVESALKKREGVDDVVVLMGDSIEAYVGSKDGVSPDALLQWCRDNLANYKIPKRFFVIPALPRTVTGKLIRNREALRQAVEARR